MRHQVLPPYPKTSRELYADDHKSALAALGHSQSEITRKLREQWNQLSKIQKKVSIIALALHHFNTFCGTMQSCSHFMIVFLAIQIQMACKSSTI